MTLTCKTAPADLYSAGAVSFPKNVMNIIRREKETGGRIRSRTGISCGCAL
jgi:hypothetical protein